MNPTDVRQAGRSGPTVALVRKSHPQEPAPRTLPAGDNPVLRAQSHPRQAGSSLGVASERPAAALDDRGTTARLPGDGPPQWIEAELEPKATVTEILLIPD